MLEPEPELRVEPAKEGEVPGREPLHDSGETWFRERALRADVREIARVCLFLLWLGLGLWVEEQNRRVRLDECLCSLAEGDFAGLITG